MADNYLEKRYEECFGPGAGRPSANVRKGGRLCLDSLILKNRSYRGYDTQREVTREELREIASVVARVPSARNAQTLRMRLVGRDESGVMKSSIRLGGALPELHLPLPGTEPEAFIILCLAPGAQRSRWTDIDLGIAAQTMLLKAVDMGLGGICIGAFDQAAVREAYLPEGVEPLLVLAVGKPAEKIQILNVPEGGSLAYFRQGGIHYVPKIRAEDLVIG